MIRPIAVECPSCGNRGHATARWDTKVYECFACDSGGAFDFDSIDSLVCYAVTSGEHEWDAPKRLSGGSPILWQGCKNCNVGMIVPVRGES